MERGQRKPSLVSGTYIIYSAVRPPADKSLIMTAIDVPFGPFTKHPVITSDRVTEVPLSFTWICHRFSCHILVVCYGRQLEQR